MFKSLTAFFMGQKNAEEGQEPEATQPPVVEQEETPADETTTEETTEPEASPAEPTNEATVPTERYQALLAAEAELHKIGATAEARAAFFAETKQLYTWYNTLKAAGITHKQDASDTEKEKPRYQSAVTAEAKKLEAKAKSK